MQHIGDRLRELLRTQAGWNEKEINRASFEMCRVDPKLDLWIARSEIFKVEKIFIIDLNEIPLELESIEKT